MRTSLIIAILAAALSLSACDKIKEMTGAGVDKGKIISACKTLTLGMKASEMFGVMGKAVYELDGKDTEAGYKTYVFTSSGSEKAPVMVSVDTGADSVIKIQCDENYLKTSP